MDTRKKRSQPLPRYSPVAAVKALGDAWRHNEAVRHGISIQTTIALGGTTTDAQDAAIMRLCERGTLPRCAS